MPAIERRERSRYVCLLLLVVVGMLHEWKAEKEFVGHVFVFGKLILHWEFGALWEILDPKPQPQPCPQQIWKKLNIPYCNIELQV